MRCLTLTQPYASLIAVGAKTIETRSWSTRYRGPLAIHAAASYGSGGSRGFSARCQREPFKSALAAHLQIFESYNPYAAPRGAIVAVCNLIACKPTGDSFLHGGWAIGLDEWVLTDQERAFGDYSPGRWAWLLADVRVLPEPIPCKGALGLWNVPAGVETQLQEDIIISTASSMRQAIAARAAWLR